MNFLDYVRSRLSWKTAFWVLLWLAAGTLLLVVSYYQTAGHPFASFLEQQVGGLCIFGAAIPVISDFLLKRDFESLIRGTIDRVGLDETIRGFGLAEVAPVFNGEALWRMMQQSSKVTMLVLRSNSFFEAHYEELAARLDRGELELHVMMPNPDNAAIMELMAAKFSDVRTGAEMRKSLQSALRTWLKERMYDRLRPESRAGLRVAVIDKYPLYSAYVFDHKEFWYIPYHHRNDRRPIPTFIFRGDFSANEIFLDLESLGGEARGLDLNGL